MGDLWLKIKKRNDLKKKKKKRNCVPNSKVKGKVKRNRSAADWVNAAAAS